MVTPTARDGLERCENDCLRLHVMKMQGILDKHAKFMKEALVTGEGLFGGSFRAKQRSLSKQKWDDWLEKRRKSDIEYQNAVDVEIARFNSCLQNCREEARRMEMEGELESDTLPVKDDDIGVVPYHIGKRRK